MAIYAARGVCGAINGVYALGLIVANSSGCIHSRHEVHAGELKECVDGMAKGMGVKKKIVLVYGANTDAFGNDLIPGKAGLILKQGASVYEAMHQLAHIKNSDFLLWYTVPLIVSVATTFFLNFKFPMGACFAGLFIGTITHSIVARWREKVADEVVFKYCDKNYVIEGLSEMKEERKNVSGIDALMSSFFDLSPEERLANFQDYLER